MQLAITVTAVVLVTLAIVAAIGLALDRHAD
jgi:hypothetical protein